MKNMKRLFVITPGKCHLGFDPRLDANGRLEIVRLRELFARKVGEPPLVVTGIGKRFYDVISALSPVLDNIPVNFSPICGTGTIFGEDGISVTIAENLRIFADQYMGINGMNKGFWPWDYFDDLEDGSLLIADGELMKAFGFTSKPGGFYELDMNQRIMAAAHHKALIAA